MCAHSHSQQLSDEQVFNHINSNTGERQKVKVRFIYRAPQLPHNAASAVLSSPVEPAYSPPGRNPSHGLWSVAIQSHVALVCRLTHSILLLHNVQKPQIYDNTIVWSLIDGHCVLPEPIGWLWFQLDWLPSVAELFRLPPLKSGTL